MNQPSVLPVSVTVLVPVLAGSSLTRSSLCCVCHSESTNRGWSIVIGLEACHPVPVAAPAERMKPSRVWPGTLSTPPVDMLTVASELVSYQQSALLQLAVTPAGGVTIVR